MASHDFFFPVFLVQGSIINARKLLDLKIKAKTISSKTPKFKSVDERPNRIPIVKVKKNKTPEIRALSSVTVESARKAKHDGKPSPNDAPKSKLKTREKVVPWKIAGQAVVNTPKAIHDHKSFLRFTFSLIKLPIIADTTMEV